MDVNVTAPWIENDAGSVLMAWYVQYKLMNSLPSNKLNYTSASSVRQVIVLYVYSNLQQFQ